MIAAIYARKSTDDSEKDPVARSTQRQTESAMAYAKAKGWTVDPRFIFRDENTSGAEWKHRPGFNALLAALDPRPPFGVVVVSELSRIGRDTVRTPAAVMRIEEAGVEIRSYLSDARSASPTRRARSTPSSTPSRRASSGGGRGSGHTTPSGAGPRPAPSRVAVSSATATSAPGPATSIA